MGTSSSVTFNDIKHLTRSMPADGLEAQDVVPPRCGCWGCPQAKHLPAFLHARARQPSCPQDTRLSRVNYFGSRTIVVAELAARPCFQFLHLGPNSAYASFGYRQSGVPSCPPCPPVFVGGR